jgi:hypothetical protein
MTNAESKIFSKVLDTNMEVKQLQIAGKWAEACKKAAEYHAHVAEIKELMGESEYDLFIEMGRKMFA